MSQVYSPLSRDERQKSLARYLAFLQQRDGQPDPEALQLSQREPYFQQISAVTVRSKREIDQPAFERNHRASSPEANLDPVMLWLLCTAKLNRGERYGVEIDMAHRQRNHQNRHDDHMTYIDLEEFYHTRILLDVLKVFGLSVEMLPPGDRMTRWLINAMIFLPKKLSTPLTLAGEIFGVVAFYMLRQKAVELFADEPEVVARVTSLYDEIMVDEIGHVAYGRARLGPLGLRAARLVQPLVTKSVLDDVPEMRKLFGEAEIAQTMARIDTILAGREGLPVQPYHFETATLAGA